MTIDSGATAWVIVATALVLFMTPGLAFFYGGMVRSKNVLGMLLQNVFAMGLVSVLWAAIGFSLECDAIAHGFHDTSYRSSGRRPVFLAIFASMAGPTSSRSWNENVIGA